jgi:TonB family protein
MNMKSPLKYFTCLLLLLSSCSSPQVSSKSSPKELPMEKPQGLIISGDSAYFPESLAQLKLQIITIDPTKGHPQFIPVDKFPQITKYGRPSLSEEVRKRGVLDSTKAKIWVDNEGNPQLAIIVESSNKILNEPSLVAAMNCRFTPAIMNKAPAAVWITIPFRFSK